MSNRVPWLLSRGVALALILAARIPASAQTAVPVEVKVLEVPRTDLYQLLKLPASTSFSKKLTGDLAQALIQNPRTRTVHQLELQSTNSQVTHFRVDSRTPNSAPAPSQTGTYYEIGIGMDVTPLVYQNRDVTLSTNSRVRILQSPDSDGRQATVFENPPTRNAIQVREGESMIVGGFITDQERAMLPSIPSLPDNALINYIFPGQRDSKDRSEIVIVLTPRIAGPLVNPADRSLGPITAVTSTVELSNAGKNLAVEISPPAPKPSPAPPSGPVYTIQVGAFESSAKADTLVSQLAKKYDAVFVDKVSGKTPYHVRVGRFASTNEAKELQKKLTRDGYDTFVTKRD